MAVVDRDSALTYRDLDLESGRLAAVINSHCRVSAQPVALLLPQGARAVVAILGILKARMFYVPFDSAAEKKWLNSVLSDVKPVMVLTDEENAGLARSVSPSETTILEIGDFGLPASDGVEPLQEGDPEDIAYIFYTSGTTGRPKGVCDSHRNVLHNVLRYSNTLAICPEDRLSLVQNPAFSGTVSSLFCALLNGACVLPVDLRRESMGSLADWIREQSVTIYHSVPALFRSIATGAREFPSVRIARLEGDRGSKRDLERFLRHFPESAVVVNGLGTTETGLVCQFFMDRHTNWTGENLPVGYPSEGMQVQIVDADGCELPPGRIGEIVVTSRFLARGYWQRPELTKAAFQALPKDKKIRTYHTGDLGRTSEDGLLEHLGRVDSKARFRGRWIVPAVIEEILASCPGVEQAVVAVGGRLGDDRLIAYLRYQNDNEPSVADLRSQLVAQLPAYSVPSRFVSVRKFPLTANGKLDRSALPKLNRDRPKLSTPYVSSCGPFQRRLVELWSAILDLNKVGIRDNFFDLGGDSLRAAQVVMGLENLIERQVPPDILYGNATIEELADALLRDEDLGVMPEVLNADGELPTLFFLHGDYISGGYYTRELAHHLGCDQPVLPIRPCGFADAPIPASYCEMAEIHVKQIRDIQPKGPYFLAGTCNGGLVALEIARMLAQHGETVSRLIMIDASASNLRYRWLWDNPVMTAARRIDLEMGGRAFLYARYQLDWMRQHRGKGRPKLIVGRLHRKARSLIRGQPPIGDDLIAGPENQTVGGSWLKLRETYQRIDHLHFPAPYDGPALLLWPREHPTEQLSDVRPWWEQTCTRIEFEDIPGNNVTCLTKYVDHLAQALSAALGTTS
jgi:amino acid adenylation domain-containing protein